MKQLMVRKRSGILEPMNVDKINVAVQRACRGLERFVSASEIVIDSQVNMFDGITTKEIDSSLILSAKSKIEKEPLYSKVAARLLLTTVYKEVFQTNPGDEVEKFYSEKFPEYIRHAVSIGRLSPELLKFDLEMLSRAIRPERDLLFEYLGIQTLYDRYFIHDNERRVEGPQWFFMRVAMGLSLKENEPEKKAMEFYDLLSSFDFMSSTPTLFNSGTTRPQLSSCFLTTVGDDLEHIFKSISDNARLSKWAGGLGNDWTNVRAMGSWIKGTNGKSQGVVPFLKVANDTLVAVNQGGKRLGVACAYLESWHIDVEEFLQLRKNTGDERRRTHDMNTSNWIPDLFMKRVRENGKWTLFSPSDVPDLHDLFGSAFEKRYAEYEKMALEGKIRSKPVEALSLWRSMLSMLFETGHPWITWKDPSNVRNPQKHVGVVHSSNLCTEILLNTTFDETAVCNLGSVNLSNHVLNGRLDLQKLQKTIGIAMRMLDNVIDVNFYPTPEARNSNLRHRPVGMGIMGFQDALYKLKIPYASQAAIEFADQSMEAVTYHAIMASTALAAERGTYSTFKGSLWEQGILPIDSIEIMEKERGGFLDMDKRSTMDWQPVRDAVRTKGMRNCQVCAIAPTATIANITGVTQSIEPTYKNLFVKSNLSGEFTVINPYLVQDLKDLGLWGPEVIDDLKYFDGSLLELPYIPQELKELYRTAFEVEPLWLIECASRRQKWIDMGQSLNLYVATPSGKFLSDMYTLAWEKGLKTTYYLRSMAATQVEKSTIDINRRGIQPRWMKNKSASANIQVQRTAVTQAVSQQMEQAQPSTEAGLQESAPKVCSTDEGCESCQ